MFQIQRLGQTNLLHICYNLFNTKLDGLSFSPLLKKKLQNIQVHDIGKCVKVIVCIKTRVRGPLSA